MKRTARAVCNANRDHENSSSAHFCLAFDEEALTGLETTIAAAQKLKLLGSRLTSVHFELPLQIRGFLHKGPNPIDHEADGWHLIEAQHDLEHQVGAGSDDFDGDANLTLRIFQDGECDLFTQLYDDGVGWEGISSPTFTLASLRDMLC